MLLIGYQLARASLPGVPRPSHYLDLNGRKQVEPRKIVIANKTPLFYKRLPGN